MLLGRSRISAPRRCGRAPGDDLTSAGRSDRERARLPLGKLLIENGEQDRRLGVVPDQRDEVQQRSLPEEAKRRREGLGADAMLTDRLANEPDQRRFLLAQSIKRSAQANRLDDLGLDALLQRHRLVRTPLEVLVELARGRQDRDLDEPAVEAGVETQVAIERLREPAQGRIVQPNPPGTSQPDKRSWIVEARIEELLPGIVELLAAHHRDPATRIFVNVRR